MGKNNMLILPVIIFLLFLAGCGGQKQYTQIDLNKLEVQQNTGETRQDTLRVAIAAITSTQNSIVYYEELLNLLGKKLGRPIEIVQRTTYAEINELLRTGQVDVAFICTYAYVTGHDQFGLQLIAAPVKDGKTRYQSYIIVRRDSQIASFAQLQGKDFAFTDPMSTTGYLYPMSLLKELGKGPESFFADYSFTYSHDNSIRAVLEGIVDGASVESLVFRHMAAKEPQIAQNLKVIKESEFFYSPPIVIRSGIPEELKKQLMEFFINLANEEEGKKILAEMGIESFRQVTDSDYDNVRALGEVVKP